MVLMRLVLLTFVSVHVYRAGYSYVFSYILVERLRYDHIVFEYFAAFGWARWKTKMVACSSHGILRISTQLDGFPVLCWSPMADLYHHHLYLLVVHCFRLGHTDYGLCAQSRFVFTSLDILHSETTWVLYGVYLLVAGQSFFQGSL